MKTSATRQLELIRFEAVTKGGDTLAFDCVQMPYRARHRKNNQLIRNGMSCNVSRYSYLILQIVAGKFAREVERRVDATVEARAMRGELLPIDQKERALAMSKLGSEVARGIDFVAVSIDEIRAFPSMASVQHLSTRLQEGAEELRHKFEYVQISQDGSENGFGGGVFNTWLMDKETGALALELNKWLRHMLYEVGSEYTVLSNEIMASLGSTRAMRLYEIFLSYLGEAQVGHIIKRSFSTEELRKLLGVDKKQYPTPNDFRKRVLEPHVEEVNAKTGIVLAFQTVFRNRETFGYEFTAQLKTEADPLTPVEHAIVNELDKRHISIGAARMIARKYAPRAVMESIVQVEAFISKTETAAARGARDRTIGSKTGLLITAIKNGKKMRYGSKDRLHAMQGEMAMFCWEKRAIPEEDREPFVERFIAGLQRVGRDDTNAVSRVVSTLRNPAHPSAVHLMWDFLLAEHEAIRGKGFSPVDKNEGKDAQISML